MTAFSLVIPKAVERTLEEIPLPWIGRVVEALEFLSAYPKLGEEIAVPGGNLRKVAVWPYTILYRFDQDAKRILIINI